MPGVAKLEGYLSADLMLQHIYRLFSSNPEHLDLLVLVCLIKVEVKLCKIIALQEQGWLPLRYATTKSSSHGKSFMTH